jgi:hypothetical protein
MYRFWDSVTRPLLEIIRPRSVAEIGVYKGEQTILLLRFAREHGAVIHAIDPEVHFPLHDYEREFPAQLRFHQTTSLEALSGLPLCDVYLIDGDHNWYTVLHELQAIGKLVKDGQHPVILLHDTGWPYGRRDQYCEPERIPAEARQPSATAGVVPDQMELFPDGINAGFTHATQEGGERNGVLTAIERYQSESPIPLSFLNLTGLHGLGILYPQTVETDNPGLYAFLQSLQPAKPVERLITALEDNRLRVVRDCAMLVHAHADLQQRFAVSVRNLMRVQEALTEAVPGLSFPSPLVTKKLADAERERESIQQQMKRMRKTLSWRMTAPLRYAQKFLREWTPQRLMDTAARDVRTLWSVVRSPTAGSAQDEQSMQKPIPVSFVPVTVIVHWNTDDTGTSQQTLDSVLRLQPQAKQVILVGNSAVMPSDLSEKIHEQRHVQWIQAMDNAWLEAAVGACTGDGVVLLEPGVILHPFYAQCGIDILRNRPSAAIACSDWYDRHSRQLHRISEEPAREMLHSACMLRREALVQAIHSGARSWDAIVTDILAQGWNTVKSDGLVFLPRTAQPERDTQPHATICLALSGRAWMWEETRAFLERQSYPHERLHLMILDTSQDASFGMTVRSWLSSCDYAHQTYLRETVGSKQLADQPRPEAGQAMSDACAAIYNRFARLTSTPVVFTLEDDVIPPDDAFTRLANTLIKRKAVTVSGSYRHRLEPRLIAWNWSYDGRPTDIPSVAEGIEQVGGTGFGCLALDGTIFSKAVFRSGPPWRNFDTNFFEDLASEERKILIDWDCRCRHYVHEQHWVAPS